MIALSRRFVTGAAISVAPPIYRLLTLCRLYNTAGAARPQLDPDYYYYNNRNHHELGGNLLGSAPMADTENLVPRRGVQWAFIGYPRVKKRVYAQTLSKLLEAPYISTASLVRQELNPGTSLYKQIANAVNRGQFGPEDIIFGLLSERLEDGYHKGEAGFILDGILRTQLQAEILDELVEVDLAVTFKCSDDFLIKHQEDGACKDKLQAYIEQSKPLEDYYRKQEKLLDFQVRSVPVATWQGLLTALHLDHIKAVYFSRNWLQDVPYS